MSSGKRAKNRGPTVRGKYVSKTIDRNDFDSSDSLCCCIPRHRENLRPIRTLVCFLGWWVFLGVSGTIFYVEQSGKSAGNLSPTKLSMRTRLQIKLFEMKQKLKGEEEKYLKVIGEAKTLLETKIDIENALEQSLAKHGIALPTTVQRLRLVEAKREDFLRTYNRYGTEKLRLGMIVPHNKNSVYSILYKIVSLFDENQIQYFLIGPTLQRLVGGSTGLSVSDHLDLQYSLSLQIGIWNTNTTMARVVKLMKSLRYELEVEINKYHGLPGDYIFLNKGDTSFAKLLFLSLFHRSRTYIWQGRPESTRLGYNFFDTTFITAKDGRGAFIQLCIPSPVTKINSEQRGSTLLFGGRSVRLMPPTLAQPANVISKCPKEKKYFYRTLFKFDRRSKGGIVNSFTASVVEAKKAFSYNHNSPDIQKTRTTKKTKEDTKRVGTDSVKHAQKIYGVPIPNKDVVEYVNGNRFTFHKALGGETFSTVLSMYSISENNFRKWNRLSQNKITTGEEYIIDISGNNKENQSRSRHLLSSETNNAIFGRFLAGNTTERQSIWFKEILKLDVDTQMNFVALLKKKGLSGKLILEKAHYSKNNTSSTNFVVSNSSVYRGKDGGHIGSFSGVAEYRQEDHKSSGNSVFGRNQKKIIREDISRSMTDKAQALYRTSNPLKGSDDEFINSINPKMTQLEMERRNGGHTKATVRQINSDKDNGYLLSTTKDKAGITSVDSSGEIKSEKATNGDRTLVSIDRGQYSSPATARMGNHGDLHDRKNEENIRDVKAVDEKSSLCTNTCLYANDGSCDDGGFQAEYNSCEFGTDCTDCGKRPTQLQAGFSAPNLRAAKSRKPNIKEIDLKSMPSSINMMKETHVFQKSWRANKLSSPYQSDFMPGKKLFSDKWEDDSKWFAYMKKTDEDSALEDPFCNDKCKYAGDGVCDDGGENSKSQVCRIGTDCSDCGQRTKGPHPDIYKKSTSAQQKATSPHPVSKTFHLYGGVLTEIILGQNFTFHLAKNTDSVKSLSIRYNVNVNLIRHWNHLETSDVVTKGKYYLVARDQFSDALHNLQNVISIPDTNFTYLGTEETGSPVHISRYSELSKGAIAPSVGKLLALGKQVLVQSSGLKNCWLQGKIINVTIHKAAPLYDVNFVDHGSHRMPLRRISADKVILDRPATKDKLDNILTVAQTRGEVVSNRVLVFGRVEDIIGGWESKLIGRTNDGKYYVETSTPKGTKTNSLAAKYFRLFERKNDVDAPKLIDFIHAASIQTLYLAGEALNGLSVVHWLSGEAHDNWINTCSLVREYSGERQFYDIALGIHDFDWKEEILSTLQQIGFQLKNCFKTNAKEHQNIRGLQRCILVRPIFCYPKGLSNESSFSREALHRCQDAFTKYKNSLKVRLTIDVHQTTYNDDGSHSLSYGVFDKSGNIISVREQPFFDLQWVSLQGFRFRVPLFSLLDDEAQFR